MLSQKINKSGDNGSIIQIQLNINPRNVTNNNIITDLNHKNNFLTSKSHKSNYQQKIFIYPIKKQQQNNKKLNKISKQNRLIEQKQNLQQMQNSINMKKRKKNNPQISEHISLNSTQKTLKMTKLNQKKYNQKQQMHMNSNNNINITKQQKQQVNNTKKRKATKKTKRLQNPKIIEQQQSIKQKILSLMIKDLQNGLITIQNFKQALLSLFNENNLRKYFQLSNDLNNKYKSQIKTQKSKSKINNSSGKYSIGSSLKNTPKHKPSKSQSEKYYQSSSFGNKLKDKDNLQQIEEDSLNIIERVIQRPDCANKIIIKGINSSLFLSNQLTQPSQQKQFQPIPMIVINTSDSVRQLRNQMKNDIRKQKNRQYGLILDYQSISQQMKNKLENQEKQCLMKNILKYFAQNKNEFMNKITKQDELIINNLKQDQIYQQNSNTKRIKVNQQLSRQFDKYVMIQPLKSQKNIQELQKQYSLMFRDRQSSLYSKISQPNQLQIPVNNNNQFNNKIQQNSIQIFSHNYGSLQYTPSKNQNIKLSSFQDNNRLIEMKQKQLEKWNHLMSVVQSQIGKSSFNSKQQSEEKYQENSLEKIIKLLEFQKSKVENQLKLQNVYVQHSKQQNSRNKSDQKIKLSYADSLQNRIHFGKISQLQLNLNKNNADLNVRINPVEPINKKSLYNLKQNYFPIQDLKSYNSSQSSLLLSTHSSISMISQLNLDSLEHSLKVKQNELKYKKELQISKITQKYINNKLSNQQYQDQKNKIKKWFQIEQKKYKQIKNKLKSGLKIVKNWIKNDHININNQKQIKNNNKSNLNEYKNRNNIKHKYKTDKQRKMIKCISQKYLKTNIKQKQYQQFKNQQQNQIKNIQNIIVPLNKSNQSNKDIEIEILQKQLISIKKHKQNKNPPPLQQQQLQKIQTQMICSAKLQKFNQEQQEQQKDYKGYLDSQQQLSAHQLEDLQDNNSQLCFDLQQLQDNENENDGLIYLKQNQLEVEEQQVFPVQNIIINKKTNINQNYPLEPFSPLKPKSRSSSQQFSEQLSKYNQNDSDSPFENKSSIQYFDILINNNQIKKLKYLTEQDKDDIFEFMFLDLCLQPVLEQSKNNKIMKSIEKCIIQNRRKKKISKGIKTGLIMCKQFFQNFVQYIKAKYFKYLDRLNQPIGPSATEMLRFMRQYEDFSFSQKQSKQLQNQSSSYHEQSTLNVILPVKVYQNYSKQPINELNLQSYYSDEQKQKSRLAFLKDLKHIHNKALFDSLNEALDLQRNFGIWGRPFPWKKTINVDRKFTKDEKKIKLRKAADKVLQRCMYYCGVLVDKQQSVFGNNTVSQDYLSQIRDDRMSKYLSNQMLQNQDRWLFYDDQQTEILVQIAKYTTKYLINQVARQILSIMLS